MSKTITPDELRDLKKKIAALQKVLEPMTVRSAPGVGGSWWEGYLAGEFSIVLMRLNSLLSIASLGATRLIVTAEELDNAEDL